LKGWPWTVNHSTREDVANVLVVIEERSLPSINGADRRLQMHFRTLVSSRTSSIISHLRNVAPGKPQSTTLLFTISRNAPDLEEIVTHLRQQAGHTVGCLSAPFAGEMGNQTVCSVAYFNARDCIPFRAEIGRPSQGWKSEMARRSLDDPSILEENLGLPSVLLGNDSNLGSVVFFSDDSPLELTRGLKHLHPRVDHLGLIASSTPFVTGRPYTMLYGDKVYSSGAIGLAFKRTIMPLPSVTYNGITPFSEEMRVTKSIGNLILEIDNDNPVQKLERAIENVGRTPDRDDVYLIAVYNEENRSHMTKVYQITAGSPSRGSLSLEGEYAPKPDQVVKFCILDPNAFSIAYTLKGPHAGSVNFVCSKDPEDTLKQEKDTDCQVIENSFIAASENGLVLPESTNSTCIAGTVGTLHFQ